MYTPAPNSPPASLTNPRAFLVPYTFLHFTRSPTRQYQVSSILSTHGQRQRLFYDGTGEKMAYIEAHMLMTPNTSTTTALAFCRGEAGVSRKTHAGST
jgi:hypothetical protein